MCFVFIDESGVTSIKSKQRYFILGIALSKDRQIMNELTSTIRDKCQRKGKPIKDHREIKYHDITKLQKEVTVIEINRKYRNFYVAFADIETCHSSMTKGKKENIIQTMIISEMLRDLFSTGLYQREDNVTIIMDEKLPIHYHKLISSVVKEERKTKKGLKLKTKRSEVEKGLQIADSIAGAFREKLLNKSDLFEVHPKQIFQVTIPKENVFNFKRLKKQEK